MPTYNFKNKASGEVIEKIMKISEKPGWLEENPDYETVILQAPALGDAVRLGVKRADVGFKDVLQKIKTAHPLGTIDVDRF